MSEFKICTIKRFPLQNGSELPAIRLAYKTYGKLNESASNVVVLPTFYTGTHIRNEGFFGPGRAIDPERHFIVSVNLFGNGISSSPDNTAAPHNAAGFPDITLHDNINAQHTLLTRDLGIEKIALVAGWSMAGCQSFQWGAQYPDMVGAILPFCSSAKTSIHNHVFLEGVKAALQADGAFDGGNYQSPPTVGLKAFGRVYAGWAFSQTFFRQKLYKKMGFGTAEDLLVDWETDHLNWDANNLLCKLRTWQTADISDNSRYNGDFKKALSSIKARTIIISCDNDLYFRPEDNEVEAKEIPGAQHRVFESPWGHCVASPGNCPEFEGFLDSAINELIGG